ncbi:MAG TPA: zf-HC2 domain-containing protein [Longimicrobiales bacterium]|nr:zf-HC2 domain-containing protein [Longimicrobiales bacterium]
MSDRWTDRLSEYVDGELAPEERAALERHLAGCGECTATLAELRAVLARAAALEDRAPDVDLWPGIAARLEPRAVLTRADTGGSVIDMAQRRPAARRRFAFTLPQLAAAAVVLMLLTGVGVWAAVTGLRQPAVPVASAAAAPIAPGGAVQFASYEATVRGLERELEARRSQLDTVTVRVVEENLKIIDRAIADARAALAADPSSAYLSTSLARAMQQKVDLLRRATALAGTTS